jgi:hypothetical protein
MTEYNKKNNKKEGKLGTRFVRGISRHSKTVPENPGRMATLFHEADSNAVRFKDVCLQFSVLWQPCQEIVGFNTDS